MQTLTASNGRIYDAIGLKLHNVLEMMAVNVHAEFQISSF